MVPSRRVVQVPGRGKVLVSRVHRLFELWLPSDSVARRRQGLLASVAGQAPCSDASSWVVRTLVPWSTGILTAGLAFSCGRVAETVPTAVSCVTDAVRRRPLRG